MLPPRWQRTYGTVTSVRLLLSEALLAAGIALILPLVGVPLGWRALLIGHVTFQTAFGIVVIQARAAGLDVRVEDAARDLGATRWRTLRTVVLPDLAPGIWAAGLLIFLFSFDDVVLSRLLSSPDTPTLPVTLLSLISLRVTPEIDALGTLIMLIGSVVFVTAVLIGRSGLAAALGERRSER
jgi:ABC-type spermidine/putrescine transport system permease subunit II